MSQVKKKGRGKAKGGAFERLICKKLSLWWTEGKRDDIFYRTASSGGRATVRSKQKKKTFGQYGDIQAADPRGQPLIDLCTIECKDGYAGDSIADLLDKEPRHNPKYEQFIQQARKSSDDAETPYWLLIARRRGRQVMVYMPIDLYKELNKRARVHRRCGPGSCFPQIRIILTDGLWLYGIPFNEFISILSPVDFR